MINFRRLALFLPAPAVLTLGFVFSAEAPRPAPTQDRLQPVSVSLTVDGAPLTVHAIPTGYVGIKSCHHTACLPDEASYPRRMARIVADDSFAPLMPIWVYLVEHPEGRFVVDTGGDAAYYDPEAWRCDPISGRFIRSFIQQDVLSGETIGARMAALSLTPADIAGVVLTHQHIDHTAGVPWFDGVPIWTSEAEVAAARNIGAVPCRWEPPAFSLVEEHLVDGVVPLTADGRVQILPTPGHTPGSLSVRVAADQGELWFVGDTTFTADGIAEGADTAGIHTDTRAVRSLHAALRGLPASAAIFPAHDADVPARLVALGGAR